MQKTHEVMVFVTEKHSLFFVALFAISFLFPSSSSAIMISNELSKIIKVLY